jgi:integrase
MGLGISVFPSGVKSFIFQGRVAGTNKKRRITLGKYGTITLKAAEELAVSWADRLAKGDDPVTIKRKRKARAITLDDAINEYLSARKTKLKPGTIADMQKVMGAGLPDWYKKPINEITREMVTRRHKKLGLQSPAQANLCFRYLRAVLNYASNIHADEQGHELLPSNPVKILSVTRSWHRIGRRTRHLRSHEIKRYIQAVIGLTEAPEREPGTGKLNPKLKQGDVARDFYMLLLLTGLRRSEALGLNWRDIDFEAKTLTIIDTKNRENHTLPLSDYLFDMLKARHEKRTGDKVLDGFSNFRYAEDRIFKQTGIRLSPHDLRRSFATAAESLDISAYAVKALLNHKQSEDITRGYIQMSPERLMAPMQKITDYFLMTAGIKKPRLIKKSEQDKAENE